MSHKAGRRGALFLFVLLYVPFLVHYGWGYLRLTLFDFPCFYHSARLATQGVSPYTPANLAAQAGPGQILVAYTYPPPNLLLFLPFVGLRYAAAQSAFLLLNHALVIVFAYLFFCRIMVWKGEQPFLLLAISYLLLFKPLASLLFHGQVNMIALVLLCVTWYVLREDGPDWLAGLALGLAIIAKPHFAILLLLFLLQRRYRFLAWTLGVLGALSVLSCIVLPRTLWLDWLLTVAPGLGYGQKPVGHFSLAAQANQSLNGFMLRFFSTNQFTQPLFANARVGRLLTYVAALGFVAVPTALTLWFERRGRSKLAFDEMLMLFMLTEFIVAPISWDHHLVFLLPAILGALYQALQNPGGRLGLVIVGLAALVLAWDFPYGARELTRGPLVLLISTKLYAVLALWAYQAAQLYRRVRLFPSP